MRKVICFNVDIVALTETKEKNKGTEALDDHIHLFSRVDKSENGSADVLLPLQNKLGTGTQLEKEL